MSKKTIILLIAILIGIGGLYLGYELLNDNNNHTGDVTIVHELGTTEVKHNPDTIVVFDYGILETLDYLDIKVSGIVKSSLPTHLSHLDTDEVINVGTLFEPDFEKLAQMKPDLIIISGRQAEVYSELHTIAPTIYLALNNQLFMESIENNFEVLGQIFTQKQEELNMMFEDLTSRVEVLQELTNGSSLDGLVIMVNSNQISALGVGSRFDMIHSVFGVNPADESIDVSTHGQSVNFEYISAINPDIMFVIDRGIITEGQGTAETLLDNSLVNQTQAALNDKIIYLNPEPWYTSTGGYASTLMMIEDITAAFA